jgi:hypothetical protein
MAEHFQKTYQSPGDLVRLLQQRGLRVSDRNIRQQIKRLWVFLKIGRMKKSGGLDVIIVSGRNG